VTRLRESLGARLLVATHNAGKLEEVADLLADLGISVVGAAEMGLPEPAETGAGRDFKMAMARVWQELEDRAAPEPRRAEFCCTLVLALPDGSDRVFSGSVPGRIVWPGRGAQGHGYDPIFQPDGHDVTFGEMDRWEKNRISHRARAFAGLVDALGRE
jgi:XTP/dITP diphosphohydrolase